jgi:UDP-N-acetyl-D-mannosaminuronate dehydrogenase
MDSVCILGLGEIGLPVAEECLKHNLNVYGFDVDSNAVNKACTKGINASNSWEDLPAVDVYEICVPTSVVFDAALLIAQKSKSHNLAAIESTVIPSTSMKIYKTVFNEEINLVHVPHRFWIEDPENHGTNQLRVIGGVNQKSLTMGYTFFNNILKIPLHIVKPIEIAEMCKIAENTYRFINIAYAENLKLICHELKLDFDLVKEACNTKWNTEILDARDGIFGHCLTLAIQKLSSITSFNNFLRAAISLDQTYKNWREKQSKSSQ